VSFHVEAQIEANRQLKTLFGMNFFAMNETTHRLIGSSMIWIYFLSSFGLTSVTVWLYYWLTWRNARQSKLGPKVDESQIKLAILARRNTYGTKSEGSANV
jgi:hypothetical protein